jgi:lysozyme
MARRKSKRHGRVPVAAILTLAAMALALAGYGWWRLAHWRPDPAHFAVQGIEADSDSGVIDWPGLKAEGGSFAYLDATAGAFAHDPAFVRNLHDARAAGLKVGAVHRYDPCQPADRQAASFAASVPRDPAMLAPAIDLTQIGDDCPVHTPNGRVESELMIFITKSKLLAESRRC